MVFLLGAVFEAERVAYRGPFAQQALQQGDQSVIERESADGCLFQVQIVDLEPVRRAGIRGHVAQTQAPPEVHVVHGDAGAPVMPECAIVGQHRIDFGIGVELRQHEHAARVPFGDGVGCRLVHARNIAAKKQSGRSGSLPRR
ncbi:MAG TPA: hypothetical protein VFY94_10200 [Rhodanobacteraceae bacterium]|nr:hypothetical protein [Rhodanobacteraceae bacterium]